MYCVDLPIQINKQNKICTEKCIMGNEKLRGGKKRWLRPLVLDAF